MSNDKLGTLVLCTLASVAASHSTTAPDWSPVTTRVPSGENATLWTPCPLGTLVLFDSAASVHEVLPTLEGRRVAVAGWFHEACREAPDWY